MYCKCTAYKKCTSPPQSPFTNECYDLFSVTKWVESSALRGPIDMLLTKPNINWERGKPREPQQG
jgi:hypothetical protein